MKSYESLTSLARQAAVAASVLVLATVSAQAADHTLVITENSSTSLTVLFDGGSVTPTLVGAGDDWTFTLPFPMILNGESASPPAFGEASWIEPDSATYNDLVLETGSSVSPAKLEVFSDAKPGGTETPVKDGQTVPGGDIADATVIDVTFFDNGDESDHRVPDGNPTALLLLVSAAVLLGASKIRGVQAA